MLLVSEFSAVSVCLNKSAAQGLYECILVGLNNMKYHLLLTDSQPMRIAKMCQVIVDKRCG